MYLVSTFQSCIFMKISEEKIASCPTYSNEDFDTQNNHLIGTFLFLLMSCWDKRLLMQNEEICEVEADFWITWWEIGIFYWPWEFSSESKVKPQSLNCGSIKVIGIRLNKDIIFYLWLLYLVIAGYTAVDYCDEHYIPTKCLYWRLNPQCDLPWI